MKPIKINRRERHVLQTICQMHEEFGWVEITGAAIAHIAGPCAGSLAGLTMAGLVTQRAAAQDSREGLTYKATQTGLALARTATIGGILIP